MKCPRCAQTIPNDTARCTCGFAFDAVPAADLPAWFDETRTILQTAYLQAPTPWQASGKSGSYENWVRLRIPNAEPVDRDGAYLDIGCANGFLLECLLGWTRAKGFTLDPHGLDFAPELVARARQRLPNHASNIHLGNAWDWTPPRRYDYVRTELDYLPRNYHQPYIDRLRRDVLTPNGKLLISQYRSRQDDRTTGWLDAQLAAWGHIPAAIHAGYDDHARELCRVYVLIP